MNKTKNFRRRAEEDENGEEETDNLVIKPPQASKKNQKPVKEKPSSKLVGSNLLSFADDNDITRKSKQKPAAKSSVRNLLSFDAEEDTARDQGFVKTKKKVSLERNLGHKISAGKTATLPSSNVQPQAGEYTKEKLLELQKNTKSLGGSKPPPPPDKPPAETVVVLKGLAKPSVEEEDDLEADAFRRNKENVEKRLGTVGIEPSASVSIPDQATINAIRAKRERLRQARAAPVDYIPLDGGGPRELLKEEAAESSDDEGEVHGRLAMVGDKPMEVKKGVFESLEHEALDSRARDDDAVGGGDNEDDDEDRRWEEEQFRKGFGKRVDDASNRATSVPLSTSPSANTVAPSSFQTAGYVGSGYASASAWAAGGISRSVEVLSMSQQAEVAKRALRENLQRLKETHGRTTADLYRVDENLSTSLTNITVLENSLASAGKKYIFMQKLRDFVAVLCDFLQDKAPYIEELEEQMQRLHEERATAIVERRASDDADEMVEVEAAINAAKSVLSKGGGSATAAAAAAAAAQAASLAARDGLNLPPQLDEFGRDINLQKRADFKRRAEARKQRRARTASKKAATFTASDGAANQHIEGESSSDESDSDCKAYQSSRDELLQTSEHVFGDAAQDFSQLYIVKERFEGWKRLYSSAYRDAYMCLSAPAIFSPFVRLELLKWDPLYEDADLNNMQWHTLLFDYGMPENVKDFEPEDADSDLVPGLVEKIALPILHHEVAHCWDRLSTRGTKNAVVAVQVILNYIPASNDSLQELLAAVRTRLAEAIAELQVPTWSIPIMNAVSQAARIAAYKFGMSVRLLKNIALWKDILAMPVLEQLALDELLCAKMLPHLRNIVQNIHDAVTRTERVVAALSGVWTGPSLSGELSYKLHPLVDFITTLGKELEKKQALGASTEDISGLARRLKRMLVELNEYDRARRILKTFQLKEAL